MGARAAKRTLVLWGLLTAALVVLVPTAAAQANVDNFSYALWSADYQVSLDDDGRSRAVVTETLVARFPDYDQNRGIIRGLPSSYLGAPLDVRVLSVTDENGAAVNWWTELGDGELRVLLGTDEFVHGLTTYVIRYEMRDVMIAATGTGRDEFYWNLLPLQSRQMIEAFDTSITLSPELTTALTGDWACYEGYRNSTAQCPMSEPELIGDTARFTVASGMRPPGYGMTVAIGFTPGTVTQPLARQVGAVTDVVPFAAVGAGAVAATVGGVAFTRMRRRARTATGIIVAQYGVPEDLPPLVAATLLPTARNVIPAQIVHLAVRGVLKIASPEKKSRPILYLADPERVGDSLDAQARDVLFGGNPAVTIPATSESFAIMMRELQRSGKVAAERRGLLHKQRSPGARLAFWVALTLVGLAVIFSIVGNALGRDIGEPALFTSLIVGGVILVVSFGFGARHLVHTHRGALAYEHLEGVREFIRVAEADRLRMLQSVEGAERYRVGSIELVHLYERLLPYAILFGEERSWGAVLETAYGATNSGAGWMFGTSSIGFSSQLGSFTTSTQASSSYTSSSSGGSGGGGSSGGGGGGGSSGGR